MDFGLQSSELLATPGSSCGGGEETQQERIGPPGRAALCVVV